MLKKGLAVAVILLFIGVAFAIPINATQEPIPDLDCEGELTWVDIKPGATVTDTFIVENIGETNSELNWEIDEYPDWGTWYFDPDGWTGLLPGTPVEVEVEVVVPEESEVEIIGEIKIVNMENTSDFCIIDIALQIIKQKLIDDAAPIEFELQRIRYLVQSIDLREIIVNPDGVIDTLEEVSSILEEEDVRNYIEKSSEEDCGCEDDSSAFESWNPVLCMLIYPVYFFAYFIFALLPIYDFIQFITDLAVELNCFWIRIPSK